MATINKTELTALIADKMGKSKAEAKSALDAVLDTLTDELGELLPLNRYAALA